VVTPDHRAFRRPFPDPYFWSEARFAAVTRSGGGKPRDRVPNQGDFREAPLGKTPHFRAG
jgi:hypothetical protein